MADSSAPTGPWNPGPWNPGHGYAAQYAIEGFRSLVLANGGAILAILSFAGNAADEMDLSGVTKGVWLFSAGLTAALIAVMCAYLAQDSASYDRRRKTFVFEATSLCLCVVSIAAFVLGASMAMAGLKSNQKPAKSAEMSCESAVAFIRAQAANPETGGQAVLIGGERIILPTCKQP